jgi:hypothetical protein
MERAAGGPPRPPESLSTAPSESLTTDIVDLDDLLTVILAELQVRDGLLDALLMAPLLAPLMAPLRAPSIAPFNCSLNCSLICSLNCSLNFP